MRLATSSGVEAVAHRVKLDVSPSSVVAVCSCGRRIVAETVRAIAPLAREHLAANGALHSINCSGYLGRAS